MPLTHNSSIWTDRHTFPRASGNQLRIQSVGSEGRPTASSSTRPTFPEHQRSLSRHRPQLRLRTPTSTSHSSISACSTPRTLLYQFEIEQPNSVPPSHGRVSSTMTRFSNQIYDSPVTKATLRDLQHPSPRRRSNGTRAVDSVRSRTRGARLCSAIRPVVLFLIVASPALRQRSSRLSLYARGAGADADRDDRRRSARRHGSVTAPACSMRNRSTPSRRSYHGTSIGSIGHPRGPRTGRAADATISARSPEARWLCLSGDSDAAPDETMPQDGRVSEGPHSATSWVNVIGVPRRRSSRLLHERSAVRPGILGAPVDRWRPAGDRVRVGAGHAPSEAADARREGPARGHAGPRDASRPCAGA